MQKRFVLALLGMGLAGFLQVGCARMSTASAAAPKFSTPYQAVLLDTGLVYYGKITGLDTDFPVLTDVYYIQQGTDPDTKQVKSVLVRRGNEWHAPSETVLNAKHIVMVEPVGEKSRVAQLIAEQKQKEGQPQPK